MTNTKATKRALLSSALAMLLCFTMLLGTTFAWFTDSVTSAGNIIQSGTLDVEMEWRDATTNGAQQTYKDAAEGAIFNYDKWEPGYVEAKNIKISNAGTLALKYQLAIVATGEVSKLADVIDVYYAEAEITVADRTLSGLTKLGTLTEVLANMSATANGDLLEGESDTVTIALKMQENAENEYQGLSIGSEFAIHCMATQLTSESDSFNDQYDAMATIDTEAELLEALDADYDYIALGANIAITNSVVIPADKTVTIDLMGYTMSQVNAQQTAAYAMISNKGNLTITDSIGTGKISYTDTTPYTADPNWASNTICNEGTLIINGGTVENLTPEEVTNHGYPHAIDAYQGSVTTINGGTVKSLNYDSIRMFCNSETLATKVVINGGTIVNRVSFQDPQSTRPGYGILEINGGNFVTINGVTANVRLLNFCKNCSNMKATVTGGTFDKGFKTQDIVNAGVKTSDWLTITGCKAAVTTAAELQAALDNAVDGDVIKLVADITGDVTVTQKPDVKITIDGNGKTFAGVLLVDGKSATILSAGLTVKNVNFVAESISADACIRLGAGKNTGTRYTCNVTVSGCKFDVPGVVGVKSYEGGDKNLVITGCTATERAHSLAQLKGIDGVLVENCTVEATRGISFNNSNNVTVVGSSFDVEKYALRFGEGDKATGAAETYLVENCTLESDCQGDAVIVLRGTADKSTLTIKNTTIKGSIEITNDATDATVIR